MQILDFPTTDRETLTARTKRRTAVDLFDEPDSFADQLSTTETGARPKSVAALNPPAIFSKSDIRRFQRDDAMAAGMMATILSLAFAILLSLAIGVNIWMQFGAR
jgi:hypothetical protein